MVNNTILNELLESRKIFLYGEITQNNSRRIVKQIKYLVSKSLNPIKIYICSEGGDIFYAFSICDEIKLAQLKGIIVYTINTGMACSAACLIFSCGNKGYRLLYPNSVTMFHNGSVGISEDKIENQKISTEFIYKLCDNFIGIFAKSCGMTLKQVKKKINNDWWMDAKEALKYKVADRIIGKHDE